MALTLALAKKHCRVTGSDEDDLITLYLAAAVAWVETYTSKLLEPATVEQVATSFGGYIALNRGPVTELTEIAYTDTDDAPGTITDAMLVNGRVYAPADGWPSIAENTEIVLTYEAGYDPAPAPLESAALLLVGEYFSNREAGAASSAVASAVESLCRPYRDALV